MIILIFMIIFFIVDTIVCFTKLRKKLLEENKDKKYAVQCEKCKTEFDVLYKDLIANPTTKSMKVVKGANVKVADYKYMARRCMCPTCNKTTWCEVKNYNEVARENMPIVIKYVSIYFTSLLFVGFICRIIMKIIN